MQIALDAIDLPAAPLRKRLLPEAVDAMAASLASDAGQTTPIVVIANGNRFELVDGRHRVEGARKLGWTEIWAEKAPRFDADYVAVAGAASNAVRAPLEPLDLWRALVALQADGRPLAAAAAALGIETREAARLDKYGRLHPEILALIEDSGTPADHQLATIARAPADAQAAALKGIRKSMNQWYKWRALTDACRTSVMKRLSRAVAIFDVDTAGVTFQHDVFAEPGGWDEWTTADRNGFMAAQLSALKEEVKQRVAKKQSAQLVELNTHRNGPELPKGWQVTASNSDKPKRHETIFLCILDNGRVDRACAINIKAEKAREKATNERSAAKAKPAAADQGSDDHHDDEEGEETAAAPTPAADISPLSKAGRDLVAEEKTLALHTALREPAPGPIAWRQLCVMLVLAFRASNVSVTGYSRYDMDDVLRALVTPAGQLDLPEDAELARIVRETLARVLSVDLPSKTGQSYTRGSGAVAEWIGLAVGANSKLARMDTEQILATTNGEALRSAAAAAGIKPAGKVSELRRQLQGNAETWRPPGAEFGAPGPKPLPVTRQRTSPDVEDAA